MKNRSKQKIKYPPLWIVGLLIISMIGGIIASVIGIAKIENYFHPYYFGFLFGGLGLLIGVLISKKVKPFIAVNHKIKNNYRSTITYISVGFIGFLILIGGFINQNLSHIAREDNFEVINKYKSEKRFRAPRVNSLIVKIDRKQHRLICRNDYWDNIIVGQKIELIFYESKLGFDYIEIKNDK